MMKLRMKTFLYLYDISRSDNLDHPYWNYNSFKLEDLDDAECWSEFRFYKHDIYRLKEVFHIPDVVKTSNHLAVGGMETLCIFLKVYNYRCRYSDMIPRFGRPVSDYFSLNNKAYLHITSRIFGSL